MYKKSELITCGILLICYVLLHYIPPFQRMIFSNDLYKYRYPSEDSYIPSHILWIFVLFLPMSVISVNYYICMNLHDFKTAMLCLYLALVMTGVLTNTLKVAVGRPRPDFFWRCFLDKPSTKDLQCIGDPIIIDEGRKSFPSGHASLAFAGLGFTSLYIAGKLHVFSEDGKGRVDRLCLCLLPLVNALLIGVSRTCDYHHHWEDVLVGSIIGLIFAVLCYYQYYPSLTDRNSHIPIECISESSSKPIV